MRAHGLFALLAMALAGCVGSLDHVSSVHDLRVLAIRTTPPDIVLSGYKVGASGAPLPSMPVVTIDALLGDSPTATRTLSYEIVTCPKADDDLRCAADDADRFVLGQGTGHPDAGLVVVRAFLGTDDQRSRLQTLIAQAIAKDPYQGGGGLPLFLGVHVWDEANPKDEVWGGSRIPLWLSTEKMPLPADLKPNVIPPEPYLLFEGLVMLPGDVPTVQAGSAKLDVFAPDPALKETYVLPTIERSEKTFTETWTYTWFTTKGYFSPETSGGHSAFLGTDNETHTTLTIPSDASPGDFQIVCVVTDGRGGETWSVRWATYPGP